MFEDGEQALRKRREMAQHNVLQTTESVTDSLRRTRQSMQEELAKSAETLTVLSMQHIYPHSIVFILMHTSATT